MKSAPEDLGFAGDPTAGLGLWAQARTLDPVVDGVQTVAPIDGTIEARYRAWRATTDGAAVYAWIKERALLAAEAGAPRIGVKSLAERARDALHRHVNNTFVAAIAADLLAEEPILRGLIELRERKAA